MLCKQAFTAEPYSTSVADHHFLTITLPDDDSFAILSWAHFHVRIGVSSVPLLDFLMSFLDLSRKIFEEVALSIDGFITERVGTCYQLKLLYPVYCVFIKTLLTVVMPM